MAGRGDFGAGDGRREGRGRDRKAAENSVDACAAGSYNVRIAGWWRRDDFGSVSIGARVSCCALPSVAARRDPECRWVLRGSVEGRRMWAVIARWG